jgi:hypothetical protein
MKRIILLVLCICISASMLFAEEPITTPKPSRDTLMIRCMFSGGTWVNEACVKSEKPTPTPPPAATTKTVACNPLLCMINHKGRCINGVCVENSLTPAPTPSAQPRH